MRFIEYTAVLMMIGLTLALFTQIGLGGAMGLKQNITGTEVVIEGQIQDNNNLSIASKLEKWNTQRHYIGGGVQSDSAQYLQAGGDFVQAWKIFSESFLGAFILFPTLRAFNVPQDICWYFVIPYILLYTLAVIEFFSGRGIEPK